MPKPFDSAVVLFRMQRSTAAIVLTAVLAVPVGAQAESFKVERTKDIDYAGVPNDPDSELHRLDVFRPVGKDAAPVIFFVHGGGWMIGDKDDVLDIYGYGTMAEAIARRGVVLVLPNYRLSPKVKHPDHIKDVARAFAWAHENIAKYGGRPDQLFLCGHSAGGHLVSLLATDESYLKAEGLSSKDVCGVISISGIYKVDDFNFKLSMQTEWLTVSADAHPFASVFGDDPEALKQASPINHVRPGLPPFLLLYGSLDYGPIKSTTKAFEAALEDKDDDVDAKKMLFRTHDTLLVDMTHGVDPGTAEEIMRFVERHAREDSPKQDR
ncbi:MAG TPA: alpha/beta hydrolase [Gemmataceae bacterium]|nr:alpha/beta hydrolase [Gemmataceae bacterium]